jgi:hypothetical protein
MNLKFLKTGEANYVLFRWLWSSLIPQTKTHSAPLNSRPSPSRHAQQPTQQWEKWRVWVVKIPKTHMPMGLFRAHFSEPPPPKQAELKRPLRFGSETVTAL